MGCVLLCGINIIRLSISSFCIFFTLKKKVVDIHHVTNCRGHIEVTFKKHPPYTVNMGHINLYCNCIVLFRFSIANWWPVDKGPQGNSRSLICLYFSSQMFWDLMTRHQWIIQCNTLRDGQFLIPHQLSSDQYVAVLFCMLFWAISSSPLKTWWE